MECHEIDLTEPIYDEGDESRCPMCRATLGEPKEMTLECGVISLVYECKCGYTLTFDYWLHRVTAEKE